MIDSAGKTTLIEGDQYDSFCSPDGHLAIFPSDHEHKQWISSPEPLNLREWR